MRTFLLAAAAILALGGAARAAEGNGPFFSGYQMAGIGLTTLTTRPGVAAFTTTVASNSANANIQPASSLPVRLRPAHPASHRAVVPGGLTAG